MASNKKSKLEYYLLNRKFIGTSMLYTLSDLLKSGSDMYHIRKIWDYWLHKHIEEYEQSKNVLRFYDKSYEGKNRDLFIDELVDRYTVSSNND